LPVQYADFTQWQRERLSGSRLQTLLGYWKEQLTGLEPLNLVSDRVRRVRAQRRGSRLRHVLSAELTARVGSYGRSRNATPFMVLLAVYQMLLARHSGQYDIAVGSPIANRTHAQLEGLIGFFVNTLVLRTDLSGEPDFDTVVERVQKVTLDAYEHQELPFERLIEALQPTRDLASSPLFRVMLVLQNAPMSRPFTRELSLEPLETQTDTAKFDQLWSVQPLGEVLQLTIEYDSDLWDAGTVALLARQFEVLLHNALDKPKEPFERLSLQSDDERRSLLAASRPAKMYTVNNTIHNRFERMVVAHPDAIALSASGMQTTYAELNRQANRIAHRLIERGVETGELIGVFVERSTQLIAGLLGVLKTGAVYVPFDPSSPMERLRFMLEDSGVRIVLTQSPLAGRLPQNAVNTGVETLFLDLEHGSSLVSTDNPHSRGGPDDLAYLIYTSGSTGSPKGAMVTHRNVVRLFEATNRWYQFGPADVWALFHSYAFDVSVWEMWGALLYGGRLVIVPQAVVRNPYDFRKLVADERVTVLNQTPSAFRQFSRADQLAGSAAPLYLRLVIFAGEALEFESLRPWLERHGDRMPRLINMYGITETTVHVTYREVRITDLESGCTNRIGVPMDDLGIRVVDKNGMPSAPGVPGELLVYGAGVCRGYYKRAELTALRFHLDEQTGERLYRSGDLVRLAHDGELHYLGRIDQQVKLRGFRIELGEIESVLRQHPQVQDACVRLFELGSDSQQLIAFIVAREADRRDVDRVEMTGKQVQQWERVFDLTYGQQSVMEADDFNISGWKDSYTGEPIDSGEMREWVEQTVKRINRFEPRRVLEVGFGTGLLLSRLAPRCERYDAIDFSESACDFVRERLARWGAGHARIARCAAHELTLNAEDRYDTVIINSVAQYFPSAEYFVELLSRLASHVVDGGRIFVGDIRNYSLLPAFAASVAAHRCDDNDTAEELRRAAARLVAKEGELLVAPAFFHALRADLPRITHVQAALKRGRADNELTRFRYDVTLCIGLSETTPVMWGQWDGGRDPFEQVSALLTQSSGEGIVGLLNLPDARVARDVRVAASLQGTDSIHRTVGGLRERLARSAEQSVDPESICARLESVYGVEVHASPDAADRFYLTVAARPEDIAKFHEVPLDRTGLQHWSSYVNNPLRPLWEQQLVPLIRGFAQRRLPEYMVPAQLLLANRIPLNVNGKVDRGALEAARLHDCLRHDDSRPESDTERTIWQLWVSLFGTDAIGIDTNFFDAGGHSLLAAQLVFQVQETLKVQMSLQSLFENPTVRGMAAIIDSPRASTSCVGQMDLQAEVVLDSDIHGDFSDPPVSAPVEVLLTGATGFFGAAVLESLLRMTAARVICLVRADNEDDGWRRLSDNHAKYHAGRLDRTRITVLCGDLAQPRLGLSQARIDDLACSLDAIYHCAALVNFTYPYSAQKAANVCGTQTVLSLAARGRRKPVHYVSTVGVFSPKEYRAKGRIFEADPAKTHAGLTLGYTQAKWVAEQIVHEAALRGMPVSIYRPGRLSGHSATGAWHVNDFFWRMLQVSLGIGAVPELHVPVDLCPVDYAADALVHLSLTQPQRGTAYHLVHPRPVSLKEFVDQVRALGHELRFTSLGEWFERARAHATGKGDEALPLLQLFDDSVLAEQWPAVHFDCSNTLQGLVTSGIECPPLDSALMTRYLHYLARTARAAPEVLVDRQPSSTWEAV
jgi:amino acid adenylation domain-containing protein/thioester reductase-like protein